MKPMFSRFSAITVVALLTLFGTATALAQTATPPSGTVVPNFDGLDVATDDTALDIAVKVQKKNGEVGESAIKGSIQGSNGKGGTKWAGASLGYISTAGDLYGFYTGSDALFEGNTYMSSLYIEKIFALTSEIRISAPDVHIDTGDFHVQDGNLQVHNGDLQVVRGDLDVTQGSLTAESIGYFYSAQASTGSNPSKQVTASCNSGDYVISCSGYDSDSLNTPANSYAGAYPYGNGCIAQRLENDGTSPLFVYAYCFSPDGQ